MSKIIKKNKGEMLTIKEIRANVGNYVLQGKKLWLIEKAIKNNLFMFPTKPYYFIARIKGKERKKILESQTKKLCTSIPIVS